MTDVLQPNTQSVDFTLLNGDQQPIRLRDYRGKNVVLAFYPADWSPVCTSELALFQETLDDIHGYNAEILGISVDGTYSHKAWAKNQRLTFPLLSDFWPHGEVAQKYGVFNEINGKSERALFFIDATGMIQAVWVAENPEIAPGINIVFDTLQHMQGEKREEVHHV
jgi:peroxiredoxin